MSERSSKKKPSNAEVQIADRTGEELPRVRLQRWVDEAVITRPTALKFADLMRDRGATVRANIASTGAMNGFSFAVDGIAFKGSDLGTAYTWAGLQLRGVTFDPKNDADCLIGDQVEKPVVWKRLSVPAYDAYVVARKAHSAAKSVERGELKRRHTSVRDALIAAQKARRIAMFTNNDCTGKPELKSIIPSLLVAEQAKEKAALKANQKFECDALNRRWLFASFAAVSRLKPL